MSPEARTVGHGTDGTGALHGRRVVHALDQMSLSLRSSAFIERVIRSIKEECLDRIVPLGEAHLRELIRE